MYRFFSLMSLAAKGPEPAGWSSSVGSPPGGRDEPRGLAVVLVELLQPVEEPLSERLHIQWRVLAGRELQRDRQPLVDVLVLGHDERKRIDERGKLGIEKTAASTSAGVTLEPKKATV